MADYGTILGDPSITFNLLQQFNEGDNRRAEPTYHSMPSESLIELLLEWENKTYSFSEIGKYRVHRSPLGGAAPGTILIYRIAAECIPLFTAASGNEESPTRWVKEKRSTWLTFSGNTSNTSGRCGRRPRECLLASGRESEVLAPIINNEMQIVRSWENTRQQGDREASHPVYGTRLIWMIRRRRISRITGDWWGTASGRMTDSAKQIVAVRRSTQSQGNAQRKHDMKNEWENRSGASLPLTDREKSLGGVPVSLQYVLNKEFSSFMAATDYVADSLAEITERYDGVHTELAFEEFDPDPVDLVDAVRAIGLNPEQWNGLVLDLSSPLYVLEFKADYAAGRQADCGFAFIICPANLIYQCFKEARRWFRDKLDIKLVYSSKTEITDSVIKEATVDGKEWNRAMLSACDGDASCQSSRGLQMCEAQTRRASRASLKARSRKLTSRTTPTDSEDSPWQCRAFEALHAGTRIQLCDYLDEPKSKFEDYFRHGICSRTWKYTHYDNRNSTRRHLVRWVLIAKPVSRAPLPSPTRMRLTYPRTARE
ncbi:hypothetical protein DL766_008618 [Monosporascus sp. MC13-8B]|uniref:Uncharacterized protein n=1 Tax=Monosporascus cannonballus TaxID=155416 RepID=A0ABY0H0S3_9PEZI|nr:hypothetical protein DL762_008420 [Monosporascus cannonballus]RYO82085.1 hypothetical protein DL763_008356 [Monosporascus cannonballus]RYP18685.1 hypothetical protein DL766_008618 [Monosporascus sp. MC13-8B]